MCGSGGRGCTEIERKIKRERMEREGRERDSEGWRKTMLKRMPNYSERKRKKLSLFFEVGIIISVFRILAQCDGLAANHSDLRQ